MTAVRVIVDALNELVDTGRLSDETRRRLSEAVEAERFGHPGFYPSGECHYEEMESVPCPICADGRRCVVHDG